MQRTFKTKKGKIFAPQFFAIYTRFDGSTFGKVQNVIHVGDFSEYEDIKKIELYENGSESLAPAQIDSLHSDHL